MKKIETLVQDINDVLRDGVVPSSVDPSRWASLGVSIANLVQENLTVRDQKRTLRMSNIGQPCERKLWYSINSGMEAEELSGATRLKFLYGHILEELLLFFAELAGHNVQGRQDTLEIEGIDGHRDAVIDGVTVDAKSASTYSYKKFENHELEGNDPFGYVDQLQSYLYAGQDDPVVTDKTRAGFLVVDKTLGNICLDLHDKKDFPYDALYRYKKEVVNSPEVPDRGFEPEPDGVSGNMKLPMNCGYCDWKKTCHPGVRTFLYAGKPRFLTTVKKEPNVPEARG